MGGPIQLLKAEICGGYMSNKIAGVVTKLVSALEGLDNADERRRAIQAALTVCGDPALDAADGATAAVGQTSGPANANVPGIHAAGAAWMQRSGLTLHDIQQVIHIDDSTASLLSAVGKGKRQQTINTYLLTGVVSLLSTGKAEFTDETARTNCESLGCYDMPNHGKTLKNGFDNKLTGSKKAGWKLTAPGLSAAAALLKPSSSKEAE
jgi:hypothetical protein